MQLSWAITLQISRAKRGNLREGWEESVQERGAQAKPGNQLVMYNTTLHGDSATFDFYQFRHREEIQPSNDGKTYAPHIEGTSSRRLGPRWAGGWGSEGGRRRDRNHTGSSLLSPCTRDTDGRDSHHHRHSRLQAEAGLATMGNR